MSGAFDKIKGKAKEATGKATDNQKMEDEGKIDQGKDKAKEMTDKAGDKVQDTLNDDDPQR